MCHAGGPNFASAHGESRPDTGLCQGIRGDRGCIFWAYAGRSSIGIEAFPVRSRTDQFAGSSVIRTCAPRINSIPITLGTW